VLGEEAGEDGVGSLQGAAHRRLAVGDRLEPDGELDRLLHLAALPVVHEVDALLDAQRAAGDLTDRHQLAAARGAAEGRRDLLPVAEDADVEAVEDVLSPDAAEDEGVDEPVDRLGHGVGLALVGLAAHRPEHGLRLVDEEEETGRVGPANLGRIGHGSRLGCRAAPHCPGGRDYTPVSTAFTRGYPARVAIPAWVP